MDKIHGLYANMKMLEQEDLFQHFLCELSKERRQHILARKTMQGRIQSLGAWTLLDRLLEAHAGLRERELLIGCGAHGKPYVTNEPHIHFSLSHSGDLVFAVLAPDEVGCDVQQALPSGREDRLAARFFSEEERAAYAAGLDFYRIWARKESWIKCDGRGMSQELRSFSVVSADGAGWKWEQPADRRLMGTHMQGYELAVCCAGNACYPLTVAETDLELVWEKQIYGEAKGSKDKCHAHSGAYEHSVYTYDL